MKYLLRDRWFRMLVFVAVLMALFVSWRLAAGRERAITIWQVPLTNTVRITQHQFAAWANTQQATVDLLAGYLVDTVSGRVTAEFASVSRWLSTLEEVRFVGFAGEADSISVLSCNVSHIHCEAIEREPAITAVEQRLADLGLQVFHAPSGTTRRRVIMASDPTTRLFPSIAGWSLGAPGSASEFLFVAGDSVMSVTLDAAGQVRPKRTAIASLGELQQGALMSTGFRRGNDVNGRPVLAVADTSPLRGWRILRVIGETQVPRQVASQALYESLLSLALVSFLAGVVIWSRRGEAKERARRLATAARLDALRAQLRPHFLFNALNTIAEFVHSDPERAEAMLEQLASLLHLSLSETDGAVVTLSREMELLEAYLEIERIRFRDTLEIETAIPESLSNAMVPSWLLQPVVENAIKFGTDPRGGVTHIRVSAQASDTRLIIEVADPGEQRGETSVNAASHRRGLSNVRERLVMLYGDDARLLVKQSAEGEGTRVEIDLPLRMAVNDGGSAKATS